MLYEALTGSLPFEGTASEVMRAKVTRGPARPGELHPGVPADLEQLCRDLLQREPARRPTGAKTIERLGGDSASRLRVVESVPLIGRDPPVTMAARPERSNSCWTDFMKRRPASDASLTV